MSADVRDIVAVGRGKWSQQNFSVVNSLEPGAAIRTNATPVTYEANEAFIVITNAESATSEGKDALVLPDYVKLTLAVSGTAGKGFKIVWVEDASDRYTSGGTSLTTLAACHYVTTKSGFSRVTTSADINVGDLTLADADDEGYIGVSCFVPTQAATIGKIGDEYITKFGGEQQFTNGVSVGANKIIDTKSPVVLGRGCSLVGHILIEGQSAYSSFDVEVGWVEVRKPFSADN